MVDPDVERKMYWIKTGTEWSGCTGIHYDELKCPNCGWKSTLIIPRNYCPRCGIKLKMNTEVINK